MISAHGELTFGFTADPELVPDLEAIATGTEQAAAALVAAVRR